MMARTQYDLTFIGAGVSSAFTLIHLMEELRVRRTQRRPLRLLVVDRDPEFWTGVPYGRRSGTTSLIITSLHDFLPASETAAFCRWLVQNCELLIAEFERCGGVLAAGWMRNHGQDLRRGACEELYLPRFFFGAYLKERVNMLLALVEHENLVQYELRRAEATAVAKASGGFRIHLKPMGQTEELEHTRRLVLATGCPPREGFTHPGSSHPDVEARFIQDSHAPCLDNTLNQIRDALTTPNRLDEGLSGKDLNVLVIGANASALELVYSLMDYRDIETKPTIHVLCPSGVPEHWIAVKDPNRSFSPQYLPSAAVATTPTAQNFLTAVAQDVELAREQGFSLADTIGPITAAMAPALDELDITEQREFVRHYGVEIGRLQRRAGGPYQDVARSMIATGRLRFIQGRFISSQPDENGRLLVTCLDDARHQKFTLPVSMSAVVNCSGFQNLQPSPSPLLSSLLDNGVGTPNSSQRGIEVNERFEAADGAYVIGPLLAGNLNATLRVRHAESCTRICGLSQQLARVLAADLELVPGEVESGLA